VVRTLRRAALKGSVVFALALTPILASAELAGASPGFSLAQQLPAPAGVASAKATYQSISCPTASSCAAVGVTTSGAFFASSESDGSWSSPQIIAAPAGFSSGALAISCPSVGNCVAAGDYATTDATLPLLLEEDSGTWNAAETVTPPVDALSGASEEAALIQPWCASAGNCEVVGVYEATSSWNLMTATETDGIWSATSSFSTGSSDAVIQNRTLDGLAFTCTSLGNCVAVANRGTWAQTAGSWSGVTALPAPSTFEGVGGGFEVSAVACTEASTCIAVGDLSYEACQPPEPCFPTTLAGAAVETSGAWAAPAVVEDVNWSFDGVSCAGDTCVAVGDSGSNPDAPQLYEAPIAATWSGGSWSAASLEPIPSNSPSTDLGLAWFNSVSCVASSDCVAVGQLGQYADTGGPSLVAPFSSDVTPASSATTPGAPADVVAQPKPQGATISWSAPLQDGGSPISTYTATVISPIGIQNSCTTASDSCTLTGLVNAHHYVVTVTANNGTADSVDAFAPTFIAGAVPGGPRDARVESTHNGLRVTWHSSSSPTDERVLRYLVKAASGSNMVSCIAGASGTSCTLFVSSSVSWRISVSAYDVSGWSPSATLTYRAN
jgi:hypothetical protein